MKLASSLLVAVLAILLTAGPAAATWSVVGVDPSSGQVGVAVASCVPIEALETEGRFELIAMVGGKGAGISQAAFNRNVPVEMERLLATDQSASAIIAAVSDVDFDSDPQDRQHGVVLLTGEAVGYTGSENDEFAGHLQGFDVSAQGNILVDEQVIVDAVANFEASAGRPLADRLVDALEAGSLAGGDSRCGDQTALFAHVSVIDENGTSEAPNVLSITTWAEDGDGTNPVTKMAQDYRAGLDFPKPPTSSFAPVDVAVLVAPLVLLGALVVFMRRRSRNT